MFVHFFVFSQIFSLKTMTENPSRLVAAENEVPFLGGLLVCLTSFFPELLTLLLSKYNLIFLPNFGGRKHHLVKGEGPAGCGLAG